MDTPMTGYSGVVDRHSQEYVHNRMAFPAARLCAIGIVRSKVSERQG